VNHRDPVTAYHPAGDEPGAVIIFCAALVVGRCCVAAFDAGPWQEPAAAADNFAAEQY
jgi:hypothetical protein